MEGTAFCSIARMCPAAILSVLLMVLVVPCSSGSTRSEMNFNLGMINTLITSVPSSDRPSRAPYIDESGVLSLVKAALNRRVTRVCRLLVEVLKVLQICAISRAAKSRSAQWLSSSGRIQSWRETMHVETQGINSCS